jgi:hypothetical protein
MFTISLARDVLRVEPGNAVTLSVSVRNDGSAADRYEVEVEGLDAEWTAIPVASFTLAPGEEKPQKILLRPPRSAESKAGSYPFIVKIRSFETGDASEAQAVLEVESFSLVSLDIEPKRESAGFLGKEAPYSVTAVNLGNTEHTLQLFADDPEDECTYQFAQERISLAPGQQRQVGLIVQPAHMPVVGSSRLFGFTVSARGVENPNVSANVQAQLERKSAISIGVLIAAFLLLAIGFALYATRPLPPRIQSFAADRAEALVGDTVTLSWSSSNATKVTIEGSDNTKVEGLNPSGTIQVQLKADTTYYAWAWNENKRSENFLQVDIKASVPPVVPMPEITQFSVSPAKAGVGAVVTVNYKVNNATSIMLQPLNATLPANLNVYRFTPQQEGKFELTLVATNSSGQAVQKTSTLTVEVPSEAKVESFRAMMLGQPLGAQEIDPGTQVTLEWATTGGTRAEIDPPSPDFDFARNTLVVAPTKTTVYVLTVFDAKNRPAAAKLTVKVKAGAASPGGNPGGNG